MDKQLKALLDKARHFQMTPADIEKQRISFAFGNTNLEDPEITREDVIRFVRLVETDGVTSFDRAMR